MMLSLIALLTFGSSARAQTFKQKTLHTFTGSADGSYSESALVNVNGTLYGTTDYGGAHGYGTIFSIKPDGTGFQTLYSFQGSSSLDHPDHISDGANPIGGLVSLNGLLYGTTSNGGIFGSGSGTVYSFDPSTGIEKVVCSLGSGVGESSYAGLISVNGLLYGTTGTLGANGHGALFSVDPATSIISTLHSFSGGSDGAFPYGTLINVNGTLYGTTLFGGANDSGTVYSYDLSSGQEHVLHTFTGPTNDGYGCRSSLINVNGVLYGTSAAGGAYDFGTIFSLHPDGTGFQVLYSFTNSQGDGANPQATLLNVNGLFYGTTYKGGNADSGTVFSFDPTTGKDTILYRFSTLDMNYANAEGARPQSPLITLNGTLYGTTELGGTSSVGSLFSLTPIVLPVAKNDSGRGIANHTIYVGAPGVLGNDNIGGDTDTKATLLTNPAHGTIAFNSNGSFTYAPNSGFVGTDSFNYYDTNLAGEGNTATCTLTIGPIAYDDRGRTYYNTPVVINTPGVLANDTTGGLSTTTTLVTNPAHGAIIFNTDGSFKYTPTTGFLGTDSFTYKIISAGGTSAPATCTLLVQARTPVANNDAGRVTHNNTLTITAPGVLGNDNAGTTGTVTAAIVTNVSHGILTFNSNGSFVYKPTTGFIGTDSFTYKDTNSVGTSNTATCTITVQ